MKKIIKIILIFLLTCNCLFAEPESNKISLIRDTEIENYLKEISSPIFITAGLNPNDINFYIVSDSSINAFVMGGQNIFINTGTLTKFDTPDVALGIIAHETGHISAGHLAKTGENMSNLGIASIGSILLGIGALLAGVPELGQAIIFGGMHVQQQSFLQYTRGQEEIADGLAIQYLNKNQISGNALLKSMDEFYIDELQYSGEMEYYSTHPLSRNRRDFIKNKIKKETFKNDNFNVKYRDKFNFIKAKILAYQQLQDNNSNIIIKQKNSDYQTYANSIVNMNNNKANEALKDINYLIEKYKSNPYFYEVKGDIYLKNNDVSNALINYNIADGIIKNNTLIKTTISFIIIKYQQKERYQEAIDNLNFIIQKDSTDNSALKLLAEVYYKNNQLALNYLTLAKYYTNTKEIDKVSKNLKLAKENTKDKKILNQIEDIELTMQIKK